MKNVKLPKLPTSTTEGSRTGHYKTITFTCISRTSAIEIYSNKEALHKILGMMATSIINLHGR